MITVKRGTRARRHGIDQLGRMLGDAAALGLGADHEAGDVLQEQQRDVALVAQLDEVRALDRGFGEDRPVIADDPNGKPMDIGGAADQLAAPVGA